ncbi:MAG: CatA-like O-acetyltransferase [Clostridia bacterium]|nr:CatA-like O-acetyltransferase [Clostridia bacterium]
MEFTPIDIRQWSRGQTFYYFTHMEPTGYSLTVNIDVTRMHRLLKNNNIKFFPAYLWLITKNLNKQVEFKVACVDGKYGYYDTLTPLYAVFHDDDKTFSFMWTTYSDNFSQFYDAYMDNQTKYGNNHGVLAQPDTPPPENSYTVSCIPWIDFQHFAIHSYGNKPYFFPTVESGAFMKKGAKILMPLSLTCHHATTDGYHINLFLHSLRDDIDNFGKYLVLTASK